MWGVKIYIRSMIFCNYSLIALELNRKLGRIESVRGESEVDEDFLSVDKFLCDHARKSEHGKTSVLEFLGVELVEFGLVFGGESKRVETNVTGEIFFLEDTAGSENVTGGSPSLKSTVELEGSNDDGEDLEKGRGDSSDLVEVTDGRTNVLVIGLEERVELDGFLGDEHTDGSKHGNTSVLKLGLAVLLHGLEVFSISESERIEVSNRVDGSGEAVREGVGIRDKGRCDRRESGDGSRSGENGDGGERVVHCEDLFVCLFVICVLDCCEFNFVRTSNLFLQNRRKTFDFR